MKELETDKNGMITFNKGQKDEFKGRIIDFSNLVKIPVIELNSNENLKNKNDDKQ